MTIFTSEVSYNDVELIAYSNGCYVFRDIMAEPTTAEEDEQGYGPTYMAIPSQHVRSITFDNAEEAKSFVGLAWRLE